MKKGFIRCAAANIEMVIADTCHNCTKITEQLEKADRNNVDLLIFPELCITGYTCADLFFSDTLLCGATDALLKIAKFTIGKSPTVIVGLPVLYNNLLYNCAAIVSGGKILGVVPKTKISPTEARHFSANFSDNTTITIGSDAVPFNANSVFTVKNCRFSVIIGDNLFNSAFTKNAEIIVNCAASTAEVGKGDKRREAINTISEELNCGFVFANAAMEESTQDCVFDGQLIIGENGKIVAENMQLSQNRFIMGDIDTKLFSNTDTAYTINKTDKSYCISKNPFISDDAEKAESEAQEALIMQAFALKKRFEHSHAKTLVLGISGGLDSTLALIAAVNCADLMRLDRKKIIAVTMPCFGTTHRTRSNAELLCDALGVTFKEVNITASVKQHLADIGHNEEALDITFENAQARERTQVLMDIANMENGLVIGTGDLSELALGWATYNGDHMSMYGINAAIPKTAVRHLVRYTALHSSADIRKILLDIIDTPVSPELLPSDENGEIKQITEDVVGPYELHDFFIYYTLRYNLTPTKIFSIACDVFKDVYTKETILKWLKTFFCRFFVSQFKRSCLPDGVSIYGISLSPRSDWHMPSDASSKLWLDELEKIEI